MILARNLQQQSNGNNYLLMRKLIAFFLFLFLSFSCLSQNRKKEQQVDIVNHEVQLGESVRLISKKYLVDPSEIYKLNKFAVNGISQGMVLQIPVPRKEVPMPTEENTSKENQEGTPVISENKVEEKSKIEEPEKVEKNNTIVISNDSGINHIVQPKETLYSLSKKYAVSVDEIKLVNATILKNGLKIGQTIKIPSGKNIDRDESLTKIESSKTEFSQAKISGNTIKHKVQPKETLYSISKKYNVTIDEIKNQNEVLLRNGLQVGQILSVKKG